MESTSSFAKVVYLLALIATIIGFTAFSQSPKEKSFRKGDPSKDGTTQPAPRSSDDTMGSLHELDVHLKNLDFQMEHLNEEMKKLDFNKIENQLNKAMEKLDMQKVHDEIEAALKKMDWKEVNRQMEESVAKMEKVKFHEVTKELEKVKTELEKQRALVHLKTSDFHYLKIKEKSDKAMKDAKGSLEKAKVELQNLRDFTDQLQSDGLIDKSKHYKIEVKDRTLYINDKKQSKEISDKYRRFYRKDNFTIKLNENGRVGID